MADQQTTRPPCCAKVPRDGGWRTLYSACKRRATVERDGKWYCRQHDPQAKEARREATRARWDAEARERDRGYRRDAAGREIVALARKAVKQQASWDDVAEAVGRLEAIDNAA